MSSSLIKLLPAMMLFTAACADSPLMQLKDYLADELGSFDNIEDIVLTADFSVEPDADWVQGEHNYDWKTGTPSNCADPAAQTDCGTAAYDFEQLNFSDFGLTPEELGTTQVAANTYTVYTNNLFSRPMTVLDKALVADYSDTHNTATSQGHDSALVLPSYGMRYSKELSPFEPTYGTSGRDLVVRFRARMPSVTSSTQEKIIITLTSGHLSDVEGDTAALDTVATNETIGRGLALVLEKTTNLDRWGADHLPDPAASGDGWSSVDLSNKVVLRLERMQGEMIAEPFQSTHDASPDAGLCSPGNSFTDYGFEAIIDGLVRAYEYYGGVYVCDELNPSTDRAILGNPAVYYIDTVLQTADSYDQNNPTLANRTSGLYFMYTNATTGSDLFSNTNNDLSLDKLDYLPDNGRFFSPNYHDNSNVERSPVSVEDNPNCDENATADECFYQSNNGYDFAVISETPTSFGGEFHDFEVVLQADGLAIVTVDGELLANNLPTVTGEPVSDGEMRGFIDNNIALLDSGQSLRHVSIKFHTLLPGADGPALESLSLSLR